ncbi:MAG: hypothetical protein QXD32_07525 [Nitrososphaerota archaeon]
MDRKRRIVSIRGKAFNVFESKSGAYVLRGGQKLLEHLQAIMLSDLPEDLIVELRLGLRKKFGVQSLDFSASRKTFKVSYVLTTSPESLIDAEEYASEIARNTEGLGFNCQTSKIEDGTYLEAIYQPKGREEIGYLVDLFEDALESADRSIEQKEENLRQELEY